MILAIIQARMGSSRLPGKVLMNLAGKPVVEHVVSRVSKSKYIEEIVIATSIEKNNIPLLEFCVGKNYRVFCGAENNVLDRFYQIAKLLRPDHIVRITADCPLHDAKVIDDVIEKHLSNDYVYTSNCTPPTYPDGLDVEVFTYDVLRTAWEKAQLPEEKEHVTPYIRKNNKIFNVSNIIDYSDKRWTLDEDKDFEFINSVYEHFYPNIEFDFGDIISFLENNKELECINSSISRNEGAKSSMGKENNI